MLRCRCFIVILFAAVLFGCLIGSARAQQKPNILAGECIGPVHVNMTMDAVAKKVGKPNNVRGYASQTVWIYYVPYNKDKTKIQIIFTKDTQGTFRVFSVAISGAKGVFSTPEGVTLGMPVEEATSRLGEKKNIRFGDLQYRGCPGLMVLEIRQGRVSRITCHTSGTPSGKAGVQPRQTGVQAKPAGVNTVKAKAKTGPASAPSGKNAAPKTPGAQQKAMIRAGEGIGPIHMFQTGDEVVRKVGKPKAVSEGADHVSWAYYAPYKNSATRIDIVFDKVSNSAAKVKYVAISGAKGIFATPEGVTLGMTAEEVRAKLGEPLRCTKTMLIYPGSPGKMFLQLSNGRVDRISCTVNE